MHLQLLVIQLHMKILILKHYTAPSKQNRYKKGMSICFQTLESKKKGVLPALIYYLLPALLFCNFCQTIATVPSEKNFLLVKKGFSKQHCSPQRHTVPSSTTLQPAKTYSAFFHNTAARKDIQCLYSASFKNAAARKRIHHLKLTSTSEPCRGSTPKRKPRHRRPRVVVVQVPRLPVPLKLIMSIDNPVRLSCHFSQDSSQRITVSTKMPLHLF